MVPESVVFFLLILLKSKTSPACWDYYLPEEKKLELSVISRSCCEMQPACMGQSQAVEGLKIGYKL